MILLQITDTVAMSYKDFSNMVPREAFYTMALPAVYWFWNKVMKPRIPRMVDMALETIGRESHLKVDLIMHPFFEYMEIDSPRIIRREIAQTPLSLEKKELLSDFLFIKFDVFSKNFKEYVTKNKNRFKKLPKEELREEVLSLFNASIIEYNEKAKLEYIRLGFNEMDVKYILDTFDSWHYDTVTLVSDNMKIYFSSPFNPDSRSRLVSILGVLKVGFELTIKDGIHSFASMNGKLETIIQRSKEIDEEEKKSPQSQKEKEGE